MVLLTLLLVSATPPTLAMPGLNGVNISASETALHGEVLAQQLMRRGLRVATSRDIQTLLGVERQKQLMGCGEQSCVAELAGSLGAEGIVQGDVGKVDERWSVTVRIIAARDGHTLAAFAGQSKSDVAALLDHAAGVLTQKLSDALHLDLVPVAEESALGPVSRWWALAPAAVAVGGGVVGALFTMQAQGSLKTLNAANFQEQALTAKEAGQSQQTIAWVGFGVAAAGVLGTAAVLIFGGERAVAPTVAMDAHGATFGVAGVLP